MNTLRQAVDDYLSLRRDLGFKLQDTGKALLDFVTFMEQQHAPSITQALALNWAQQPADAQPAYWARRLSMVRGFARYYSAIDPRTQIPAPGFVAGGAEHAAPLPKRRFTALGLLLPVRASKRHRPAPWRSASAGA